MGRVRECMQERDERRARVRGRAGRQMLGQTTQSNDTGYVNIHVISLQRVVINKQSINRNGGRERGESK